MPCARVCSCVHFVTFCMRVDVRAGVRVDVRADACMRARVPVLCGPAPMLEVKNTKTKLPAKQNSPPRPPTGPAPDRTQTPSFFLFLFILCLFRTTYYIDKKKSDLHAGLPSPSSTGVHRPDGLVTRLPMPRCLPVVWGSPPPTDCTDPPTFTCPSCPRPLATFDSLPRSLNLESHAFARTVPGRVAVRVRCAS